MTYLTHPIIKRVRFVRNDSPELPILLARGWFKSDPHGTPLKFSYRPGYPILRTILALEKFLALGSPTEEEIYHTNKTIEALKLRQPVDLTKDIE